MAHIIWPISYGPYVKWAISDVFKKNIHEPCDMYYLSGPFWMKSFKMDPFYINLGPFYINLGQNMTSYNGKA